MMAKSPSVLVNFTSEEDNLSQECKELLLSLPREKNWLSGYFYNYQGIWTSAWWLQGVLGCQKFFQAQRTDIFLVTVPKSGTTWLKALIFTLLNRHRFNPADTQKHPLITSNPHDLVPFLETLYECHQNPDFSSFTSPRFFHSHLSFVSLPKSVKDSGCKLVYLCRNPKDNFVSNWHFYNKVRSQNLGLEPNSLEKCFDMFCRGKSHNGPFWEHVMDYWKESLRRPEKILFLKYEEMKEQPSVHLRRLAEFLGFPFSSEEEKNGVVDKILGLCSFNNLSNLEPNKSGKIYYGLGTQSFFRQGVVGDWKNYLTDEMAEKLDQITAQKFHGSGLEF